jgi:hypothetical protein
VKPSLTNQYLGHGLCLPHYLSVQTNCLLLGQDDQKPRMSRQRGSPDAVFYYLPCFRCGNHRSANLFNKPTAALAREDRPTSDSRIGCIVSIISICLKTTISEFSVCVTTIMRTTIVWTAHDADPTSKRSRIFPQYITKDGRKTHLSYHLERHRDKHRYNLHLSTSLQILPPRLLPTNLPHAPEYKPIQLVCSPSPITHQRT